MTEPGCGSDVNGVKTKAVKKGNEVRVKASFIMVFENHVKTQKDTPVFKAIILWWY